LIRAARYLGVAPWDLAKQPIFWKYAALAAESAENLGQEDARRAAEARRSPKR